MITGKRWCDALGKLHRCLGSSDAEPFQVKLARLEGKVLYQGIEDLQKQLGEANNVLAAVMMSLDDIIQQESEVSPDNVSYSDILRKLKRRIYKHESRWRNYRRDRA